MPNELAEMARQYNAELKQALQAIFTELNKGQTNKILKNPTIAKLVERYGVEHK